MAALPPELWMMIFKHLRRLWFLDNIRKIEAKEIIHKPSVTMCYDDSQRGLLGFHAIAVLNIFVTHRVKWFTGLSTLDKIYWRKACIHRRKQEYEDPDWRSCT